MEKNLYKKEVREMEYGLLSAEELEERRIFEEWEKRKGGKMKKEKIAVRHYSCDLCKRQIFPGEKIIIINKKNDIDIYCWECGKKEEV